MDQSKQWVSNAVATISSSRQRSAATLYGQITVSARPQQTFMEPQFRHQPPQTIMERAEAWAEQATEGDKQQINWQHWADKAETANGWLFNVQHRHSRGAAILQHIWAGPSSSARPQHANLGCRSRGTIYGQLPAARITDTSSNPIGSASNS